MERRAELVNQIRAFNRFYTVIQGFLDRNYLDSGYSVTEARILFELDSRSPIGAASLTELLHLDKGYVSRLIRSFEQKGLIVRRISSSDARVLTIHLTPQGHQEVERLIAATNAKLYGLLEPLSDEACCNLSGALRTIMQSFQGYTELKGR